MPDIINENYAVTLSSYLIIVNVLTFALYAIDKRRAIKGERRISERTLLLSTLFLGGVGSFYGLRILRHKTQKPIFKWATALSLILIAIAIFFALLG